MHKCTNAVSRCSAFLSGLVGKKLPKFSIFGDTMNTASRMESTSLPGTIQISATTWEMLAEYEEWKPTGGVEIKGKGIMETFFWVPPPDFLNGNSSSITNIMGATIREGEEGTSSPICSLGGSSARLSSKCSSLHRLIGSFSRRASMDAAIGPSYASRLAKQSSADIQQLSNTVYLTKSSMSSLQNSQNNVQDPAASAIIREALGEYVQRTSNNKRWLHGSLMPQTPHHHSSGLLNHPPSSSNVTASKADGLEILSSMLSIHSENKKAQRGLIGRKFASSKERPSASDGLPVLPALMSSGPSSAAPTSGTRLRGSLFASVGLSSSAAVVVGGPGPLSSGTAPNTGRTSSGTAPLSSIGRTFSSGLGGLEAPDR